MEEKEWKKSEFGNYEYREFKPDCYEIRMSGRPNPHLYVTLGALIEGYCKADKEEGEMNGNV